MAKVKVKKRKLNDVEEIDGLATSISSAASTGKVNNGGLVSLVLN